MIARSLKHPAIVGAPMEEAGCPVCGEIRHSYLFVIRGLPITRCPGCGLVSLHPQPGRVDFERFYEGVLGKQDPRLFWTDSETERDAVRHYVQALRKRGLSKGRVLLMAPPGHPFCLEAQTAGLDVVGPVSIADMEDGLSLGESYDAAVVLYQLEKAGAPARLLRKIHAALKPEGLFLLAVPSLDSWPARFFKDQWTEWRPENRFYFNQTTIHSLLLKSGFDRVRMEPDRRLYTLRHVHDRAAAFPRTALTRLIARSYQFAPPALRNARIRLESSGVIVTAARAELRDQPLCSIVVPVYNERQTFPALMDELLVKRLPNMEREIIIVESNSKDGSRDLALQYAEHPEVRLVLQDSPRGKGNAVRAGFERAQGDIIMIQDADLEYDLNDYDALLEPLVAYRSMFVLGARHGGSWKMRQFTSRPDLALLLNLGHVFFTTLMNLLYGQRMKDPFTMFKVFRRDCLYGLKFECNRFDFDYELVIKLVRKGYVPLEIPVNYKSRSFSEGKKVSAIRDPITWIRALIRFRLTPLFDESEYSSGDSN